jgi:hypothetical protein
MYVMPLILHDVRLIRMNKTRRSAVRARAIQHCRKPAGTDQGSPARNSPGILMVMLQA